jgi:hypothetical protein
VSYTQKPFVKNNIFPFVSDIQEEEFLIKQYGIVLILLTTLIFMVLANLNFITGSKPIDQLLFLLDSCP